MSRLTFKSSIERHPGKVSGQWVFRGTRVPITALFENLRDGATIDQFLEWFPGVKREQVVAVLEHEMAALSDFKAA
jgi:uncharacterized protein (DUF433 family)